LKGTAQNKKDTEDGVQRPVEPKTHHCHVNDVFCILANKDPKECRSGADQYEADHD
jgi:hypothetical protein